MKSLRTFVIVQMFLLFGLSFSLKVGYYDNYPLCYDDGGVPKGLFVDIFKQAFGKEASKFEFVFGEFSQLMEQLKEGKIDLLMVIAETKERKENFSFNKEVVVMNWGVLVSSVNFRELKELDGERIAANRGDIYYQRFKELLESFNIKVEYTEFDTYYDVLREVNEGNFKYGVVSRLSFLVNSEKFPNVYQTSYVFSPVPLKFATKKNTNTILLEQIDKQLIFLNSTGELNKMFNSYFLKQTTHPRTWSVWFLLFIAASATLTLVIYLSVRRIRKISALYNAALGKLREENAVTSYEFQEGKKIKEIYEKPLGMELLRKYEELSKRESHAISILAIEIGALNETQKEVFEKSLFGMTRPGDFVFKYSENNYIIVMYSYASFMIEMFRKGLLEKLSKSGIETKLFLGLKVFNPQTEEKIEKTLFDAFAELEKDKEFRKKIF
ncbi:MAG: transporter substrate-binding domain-containing protein [Fervidobacterium sp.]